MAAHARMWFDYEVTSDIIVCMLHFYLFSLWFAWTVCALCLWHPVPVHGVFLLRYHFTMCLDQWDFRLILDARTLLRSQTASFFKLLEGVRVGFTVRIRKIVHQIYSPPGSRGYAQERRLSRSRICKHRQTRMQRLLMLSAQTLAAGQLIRVKWSPWFNWLLSFCLLNQQQDT